MLHILTSCRARPQRSLIHSLCAYCRLDGSRVKPKQEAGRDGSGTSWWTRTTDLTLVRHAEHQAWYAACNGRSLKTQHQWEVQGDGPCSLQKGFPFWLQDAWARRLHVACSGEAAGRNALGALIPPSYAPTLSVAEDQEVNSARRMRFSRGTAGDFACHFRELR